MSLCPIWRELVFKFMFAAAVFVKSLMTNSAVLLYKIVFSFVSFDEMNVIAVCHWSA